MTVATTIDLDESQVAALDRLGEEVKRTRAELLHDAVRLYLVRHPRPGITAGFGLWGDHVVDGLEYQERIRNEW